MYSLSGNRQGAKEGQDESRALVEDIPRGGGPVGMAHQPHKLVQQVLQGPGAWEHLLGFLCQQPC